MIVVIVIEQLCCVLAAAQGPPQQWNDSPLSLLKIHIFILIGSHIKVNRTHNEGKKSEHDADWTQLLKFSWWHLKPCSNKTKLHKIHNIMEPQQMYTWG